MRISRTVSAKRKAPAVREIVAGDRGPPPRSEGPSSPLLQPPERVHRGPEGAGVPRSTAQKRQFRVQLGPRMRKVAVLAEKHSHWLGQRASWQTVWRFPSLMSALTFSYSGPVGSRVLSHAGFRVLVRSLPDVSMGWSIRSWIAAVVPRISAAGDHRFRPGPPACFRGKPDAFAVLIARSNGEITGVIDDGPCGPGLGIETVGSKRIPPKSTARTRTFCCRRN